MSQSDAGERPRIAFYLPTLAGGGAEAVVLRLAAAFVDLGFEVDLVVNRAEGAYTNRIPEQVNCVVLKRGFRWRGQWAALRAEPADIDVLLRPVLLTRKPIQTLRYLPGLIRYLRQRRPAVLIAAMFQANLLALWARRRAVPSMSVVVCEHNTLTRRVALGAGQRREAVRWQMLPEVVGRVYAQADAVVAVSNGVADDLAEATGLPRAAITTLYNPATGPDIDQRAAEDPEHPWLSANAETPVILAIGRLVAQKGFLNLIEAFTRLREERQARLIILGEGELRTRILDRAHELGIAADIDLPGWVDNPCAYLARARLYVLSSDFEGLPLVLIEALACGCPVVATDCPHGPREILDSGGYGRLVPVGDAAALAQGLQEALDAPVVPAELKQRAADFSIASSVAGYHRLIRGLIDRAC
ncbi:glycosyltransferase [Salinisphaera sp. SPP-AMP-43]|uniref:glycosyltransferase n=1 Tax=Salinisphaera sp. SPP-AMP-43 TaxID=3121288 RepID=UPI003C6E1E69